MTRLVLFLGAGFSQPFGLPTMEAFRFFAHDSKRISDQDKGLLDEVFQRLAQANNILRSSRNNLEDALSFWMMGDRLRLDGELEQAPQLKRIIQRIYTSPGAPPSEYWNRFQALSRFLRLSTSAPRTFDLVVITTNYDVCVESALAKLGMFASLPISASMCSHGSPSTTASLYSSGGVPVLKLHGSVNWFEDPKDASISVDDRVVRTGLLSETPGELPYVCARDYEMPGTPLIVPPTFIKPELSKLLEHIWRTAAVELNAADYIAFIGYSFPPTDTEMRYFIGRSLADNRRLRRVFVFDNSAGRIVEQLSDPLRGYGQHFHELLAPINGDWTTNSLVLP